MKTTVKDAKFPSIEEGRNRKFLPQVGRVTYSGEYGAKIGQRVLYVTERCVFELREEGLTLTEIAPGIDLEENILPFIDFEPIIADDLKRMDERIFKDELMNLRDDVVGKE